MAANWSVLLGMGLGHIRRRIAAGRTPRTRRRPPPISRNPDTVKLIYEHTKNAPQYQLDLAKALDDKMTKIFAAAGIVIGLAGFSRWPTNTADIEGSAKVLFALGLGAFVATALLTVYHLWPRTLFMSTHAGSLWRDYRGLSEDQIRQMLADSICRRNSHNDAVLKKKSLSQICALISASLEVLCVGAAILITRL
jgi:hypothetical protein